MNANSLTEAGWKAANAKARIKDNGLQKALGAYENLDETDHDARLKCLASISQIATTLKKGKEVDSLPNMAKYLDSIAEAVASEKNQLTKAKAAAEKAAESAQKKKAGIAPEEKEDEENDSGQESDDYSGKLLAAFQKLKSSPGLAYEFVVCDAKPVGVMVAKKISAEHRANLAKLTGSKRFLAHGTCSFQDGKFSFAMVKPVGGIARRLQESIKIHTGKKLPIVAGNEAAEDTEEPAAAPADVAARPESKADEKTARLHHAAETWHGTRKTVDDKVKELKKAIQGHYAGGHPDLLTEIDKGLSKLDAVLDKLDHRLAESLSKAGAAPHEAVRQSELKNTKSILTEYIAYIKSEPLIAHIDSNPFGVKTNLRQTLIDAVTHAAKSIG